VRALNSVQAVAAPLASREVGVNSHKSALEQKIIRVDLEPVGRRAEIQHGITLLEASQSAGVELVAVCGGVGTCGKCRVQLMEGALSPVTAVERRMFSESELVLGYRLACQAKPLSDVKINIPPESLTTLQRLQIEGQEATIAVEPSVIPVDLKIAPPDLYDLRADTTRLKDAARELPHPPAEPLCLDLPVLSNLSEQLRAHNWAVRLALRGGEVVVVLPQERALLGLAVDIGTTKVAAYLVDLASGVTLAKAGMLNPQVAYGEDVVSRIAYTNEHPAGRQVLQARLVEGLNTLVGQLCEQVDASPDQIVDAAVVGNTAIHHLFAGLPVRQLGAAPYLAAVSEALEIRACDLGLSLAPGTYVYLPPNIAGYVGADHVSALLAADAWRTAQTTVVLDIGTNTEISLVVNGRILSCSCASGPAFEGAHIHDGMRAAPGAIERVQIVDGTVRVQTIGNQPPVGICGTGILDAVAEMRAAGLVNHAGRLLVQKNGTTFTLVPASDTGHGRDILVTRRDINEIQLAKGAIRAGIEVLLREAGIASSAIEAFVVAGAFGTYLDVESAVRVGMFPDLPRICFQQVGNAAGIGAKQLLISARRREIAAGILERVEYIELTTHPEFTDVYMEAVGL